MITATFEPTPPWRLNAKIILAQLETEASATDARTSTERQQITAISTSLTGLNNRRKELVDAAGKSNGHYENPEAARAQLAGQIADIDAEATALGEALSKAQSRHDAAARLSGLSASLYNGAKKVYRAITGQGETFGATVSGGK